MELGRTDTTADEELRRDEQDRVLRGTVEADGVELGRVDTTADDDPSDTGDELGRTTAEELPITGELEDIMDERIADDELSVDETELEEEITAEELDNVLTAEELDDVLTAADEDGVTVGVTTTEDITALELEVAVEVEVEVEVGVKVVQLCVVESS